MAGYVYTRPISLTAGRGAVAVVAAARAGLHNVTAGRGAVSIVGTRSGPVQVVCNREGVGVTA